MYTDVRPLTLHDALPVKVCFLLRWGQCLRLVAAEVGDRAAPAFGRTSLADVTAVEDQPVMCADAKRRGHLPFELLLDRKHGLSGRKAGAVADAEDMGIDRKGLRPEGAVHHDIRRLAPDAGQFDRSEEHTSELQSLMRISYAVFCLKKKKTT